MYMHVRKPAVPHARLPCKSGAPLANSVRVAMLIEIRLGTAANAFESRAVAQYSSAQYHACVT